MEVLSAEAYRAYRNLVYETEGFDRFFRESTVIDEIANLNIGSRPSSRKSSVRIEDLRGMPVVVRLGAWPFDAPGWVGLRPGGQGLVGDPPDEGIGNPQAMY